MLAKSLSFAVAAYGCLFSASNAVAAPIEWAVLDGGNGHFYEAIKVESSIGWDDASAAAMAMTHNGVSGHLATLTSLAENTFVHDLVKDDLDFWITDSFTNTGGPWLGGFQDLTGGGSEPADGWMWVTGEPFVFTNWDTGKPDNFGSSNERFIHFFDEHSDDPDGPTAASTWNDAASMARGFIVEYSPASSTVPEPSSFALLASGAVALCAYRRRQRKRAA